MEPYHQDIYGKILFSCKRSRAGIVILSLFNAFAAFLIIIYALARSTWYTWMIAGAAVFLCLWKIDSLHRPIVLVCEKGLLAAGPRNRWRGFHHMFQMLYFPMDYNEIRGISENWDIVYVSPNEEDELAGVPVSLSLLSRKDKENLQSWILKMKEEQESRQD